MAIIDDGPVTETEVKLIANEIKGGLRELVEIMEMEYCYNEVETARDTREPSNAIVSEYAAHGGTRYEFAQFLRDAKFVSLSLK